MPASMWRSAQVLPAEPDAHPTPTAATRSTTCTPGAVIWTLPGRDRGLGDVGTIIDLVCPGQGNCRDPVVLPPVRDVAWPKGLEACRRRPGLSTAATRLLAGTGFRPDCSSLRLRAPRGHAAAFALLVHGRLEPIDIYHKAAAPARDPAGTEAEPGCRVERPGILFIHAQRATSACVYRVEVFTSPPADRRGTARVRPEYGQRGRREQRHDPLGVDRHLIVTNSGTNRCWSR